MKEGENEATGSFAVILTPAGGGEDAVGRMTISKTFSGDLEATSAGEMLSVMGSVKGSAGYVAMERVTGALEGRRGSFALQHSGSMDRGAPTLAVEVVPDSGTDDLAGLSGRMTIDAVDGAHRYAFRYRLADESQGA